MVTLILAVTLFVVFYLIFTASWKKIVIPIVLGVPAILIPFPVYYYCRFYKKQDNNAVTVQQGSVHLKRPRGDQKTKSLSCNV